MRTPTQNKPSGRQQISSVINYPAPVGGWNAVSSLADMKPDEAIVLDNFFPKPAYCELRGGSIDHATGMTGTGKTLMVYNSLTGSNSIFCTTSSGTYNVSTAGAVGASVAARTNGKHQHVMFGDGTSQWLIAVNGVDKPLYYNGTTWTAVDGATSPALTGVTTTNLINVAVFKGRLMFIEKSTMAFWYLASGVAGGALTKFDLSGVAQKGGYIVAMSSWTVDSGTGPDDRMVFVTSEGELIVYQGTNPAAAATWELVGVYTIGRPLGYRCLLRVDSDLIIMTQNGAFPITSAFTSTDINYVTAVSRKIENAFNDAARTYFNNFGWSATLYPAQSAVIVNIPIAEDSTHYQYVMNTITRSWCRFTDWNAEDFAVYNNELYFCTGTKTVKAWTGVSDNGANIVGYGKTAFSYFGKKSQLKKFRLYRPILATNGPLGYLTDLDIDFADAAIINTASTGASSASLWDAVNWDSANWAAGIDISKSWTSTNSWPGFCASGKLRVDTNGVSVQWISNDYAFETGGVL